MAEYWIVDKKANDVARVNLEVLEVQKTKKRTIILYRDTHSNMTYSSRTVKTWEQLTADQKSRAYRNAYLANRSDAISRVQADPDLEPQYPAWIEQLKQERDAGLALIANGEPVNPPRRVWE